MAFEGSYILEIQSEMFGNDRISGLSFKIILEARHGGR
jgi:hypothetical protein